MVVGGTKRLRMTKDMGYNREKKWFPCGESNPGRGGESAES